MVTVGGVTQPDVSREDVRAAMQEFDRLGRDGFLAKYEAFGHRKARDYFVNEGNALYDSKVLVAAAHGIRHGRPLRADEFSGGDSHVALLLRRLGFTVTRPGPDWTADELTLVCAVVVERGWRELRTEYPEAVELSALLRSMPTHPQDVQSPSFRSPASVSRKSSDLVTRRGDYTGERTRGGRLDQRIVDAFLAEPEANLARARALRDLLREPPPRAVPDLDGEGADEGGLLERWHLAYERDRGLRERKIRSVLNVGDRIECEVCSFNFENTYGERGHQYIEVHHRTPLHASGPTRTNLADLALLCSNCHRMIHRQQPWLTVAELRVRVGQRTDGSDGA
jgi:5-methylcytosine-specific restriction protein A